MDGFDRIDELDGGLVREGHDEVGGDPRSDPLEVSAPERADDHGPTIAPGQRRDSGVPEPSFDGFRICSGEHDDAGVNEALRCRARSNLPSSLVWPHPVHGGHGGRAVKVSGQTRGVLSNWRGLPHAFRPSWHTLRFPIDLSWAPE